MELHRDSYPLVSAIIPAYNAERFVGDTIRSVLSQTYENLEIIVVDDGSTDGTVQIVQQLAKIDSRIMLLRQPNSGVAAARNLGISRSRGKYIAPLDADDTWFPRKIEMQVECIEATRDASVGLVYAWSASIDEAGTIVGDGCSADFQGSVFLPLVYANFIGNASAPLIRRSCLDQVGCFSTVFHAVCAQGCEDWDLYLRISEHFRFAVVREYLVGYRIVAGSMSGDSRTMEKSFRLTAKRMFIGNPHIDPRLINWSRSKFYYYLACKCVTRWRSLALRWLLKSIWYDPLRLISPPFHRTVLRILLGQYWHQVRSWVRNSPVSNAQENPEAEFCSALKRLKTSRRGDGGYQNFFARIRKRALLRLNERSSFPIREEQMFREG